MFAVARARAYVCVRLHACAYVCVRLRACVCVRLRARVCEFARAHVCAFARAHVSCAGVQRAHKIKKQGFYDCQRARRETLYIGDMRRRSAASHATKKPIFGVTFGCLFLG